MVFRRVVAFLCIIYAINCSKYPWFIDIQKGRVAGHDFDVHYVAPPKGAVITLIPTSGDPDLYIAENGIDPGTELHQHSYKSATSGIERIFIPPYKHGILAIGVYGHPSHEKSSYILKIMICEEPKEPIEESEPNPCEEGNFDEEIHLGAAQQKERYGFLYALLEFFFETLIDLLGALLEQALG